MTTTRWICAYGIHKAADDPEVSLIDLEYMVR